LGQLGGSSRGKRPLERDGAARLTEYPVQNHQVNIIDDDARLTFPERSLGLSIAMVSCGFDTLSPLSPRL
jgi:hypothetical protein